MESTFKIQFDCTERLERVLKEIAEGLNALKVPQPTTTRTRKAKVEKPVTEEMHVEETAPEVKEEPKPEPKVVEVEVKPSPKAETPANISDADLRKAMNDCRKRVLGENANDGILRKAVNDTLREKVADFGCSTSTDLSQEQRVVFVKFCEELEMPVKDEVPY